LSSSTVKPISNISCYNYMVSTLHIY